MKWVVPLIIVVILSTCNGNIYKTIEFLNDIKFHQLDFVNYTSITFVNENLSDESLNFEEIYSLHDYIYFDNKLEVSDTEFCSTKTLAVISIDSSLLNKNQNYSFQGDFIQNSCQIFLIFASIEVQIDDKLYAQLKHNLVHQPFVFILMPKNDTETFELFEIQVPMKKLVKLISWVKNEPPRCVLTLDTLSTIHTVCSIFNLGILTLILTREERI